MSENPIAMEQRHIVEGEARIAQQKVIVAGLEQRGHEEAAETGRELLHLLRSTLGLARERLARLTAAHRD